VEKAPQRLGCEALFAKSPHQARHRNADRRHGASHRWGPMSPLALTDSQLETVYRCAGPLAPAVRPAFLELVAQSLADAGEIGDGTVARACREAQARFWIPPDLSHPSRRD
jgi:hypothetical protein